MEETARPPGAGKSSIDLVDLELLFGMMGLKDSTVFLDLGCGRGNYLFAAAERIGPSGRLYGVDIWADAVAAVREKARDRGYSNVQGILADVTRSVPLPDRSVDICLMATVLHDFKRRATAGGAEEALKEAERLLKPGGILVVIEFKKIEGPPGPPAAIRLAPAEVEMMGRASGFVLLGLSDLGPFIYVIVLVKR